MTAAPHPAAGTCFGFIPCPDGGAAARAAHQRLAAAPLAALLPPARLAEQAAAVAAWEQLDEAARVDLGARLGWRLALFADHDWLLPHLVEPLPAAGAATWLRAQCAGRPPAAHAMTAPPPVADRAAFLAYAERLLAGDLSPAHLPGYWVHPGPVSWLPPDGTPVDNEIVIQALRLYPHRALAHAWHLSGDARYARGAIALLADLTWETPGTLIQRVGLGGCRTHWAVDALDVACRTEHLLTLVAILAPAVDDAAALLLAKLLWFSGARGHEFWHKVNHNIAFYEGTALARLGALWPSFRAAGEWCRDAQHHLADALHGALLADGSNVEGQFGYHHAYLASPERAMDTLAAMGQAPEPAFAAAWAEHAAPALEFWARAVTPDRRLPNLGDGYYTPIGETLRELAQSCGSPLAAAIAAAAPAAWPRETSWWFTHRRLAILRSGWEPTATWAAFDLRGFIAGHDHYHLGHLQLHAADRALLIDSGVSDYCENRARSRATRAHNTLEFDGQDHAPGPAVDLAVHLAPSVDWVAGLLLPAAPGVLHRRAVCFLKPDWLLVLDRVTPLAPGQAQTLRWSWHLGQGLTPALTSAGLLAAAPGGPGLALDVAATAATELALEPGFFATGYLQTVEVPVAVVTATLTGPLVAATLLRIVPDGATPPPVTVRVAPLTTSRPGGPAPLPLAAGCAVTVTAGERTAEVLWAEPGAGRKHLGDWTTDGDLLLAVTGAAGPAAWALGARRVTWRGTPFACHPFPPFATTPACQGRTP